MITVNRNILEELGLIRFQRTGIYFIGVTESVSAL